MALTDVSKTITIFQRLCRFAEEFTEEHRPELSRALTALFRSDLEDEGQGQSGQGQSGQGQSGQGQSGQGDPGQDGPALKQGKEPVDVDGMIDGFLRRLRRTLGKLTLSETELLGAIKESASFRDQRDGLTVELRDLFGRGRSETRTHFSERVASAAGFPARILEDGSALLRQTKLVSWTLNKPDFSLGESPLPDSTVTKESILKFFEPKAEEFEEAAAKAIRCRARVRGKQVVKNKEVEEFRTTYALFINLIKSSFRLAGQPELAKWVSLNQPRRSRPAPSSDSQTGNNQAGDSQTGDNQAGDNQAGDNQAGGNQVTNTTTPNTATAITASTDT